MAETGQDLNRALMAELRRARELQRLSVRELAERAGVFHGTLLRYLNNHREMPVSVFYDIAIALRVEPVELMARAERALSSLRPVVRFRDATSSLPPDAAEIGQRISLLVEVLARGRGSRYGYAEISPSLHARGVHFSETEWAALLESDAPSVPTPETLSVIEDVLGALPGYLSGAGDDPNVMRFSDQLELVKELQSGRVQGIAARTTADLTPETLRAITSQLRDGA